MKNQTNDITGKALIIYTNFGNHSGHNKEYFILGEYSDYCTAWKEYNARKGAYIAEYNGNDTEAKDDFINEKYPNIQIITDVEGLDEEARGYMTINRIFRVEDIKNFLDDIKIGIDFNVLDYDEIDEDTDFNKITELLDKQAVFNYVFYDYVNAIEYLRDNNISLKRSLELAQSLGYTIENVDSEVLAGLLKSDILRNDWEGLRKYITDFLDSLEW